VYKKFITPQHAFILLVTLFLMVTGNAAFFHKLAAIYPPGDGNLLFILSITAFFAVATALFLNLICYGRATPWVLTIVVFSASLAAYFMDSYGVVIDVDMLENVRQTDVREARELMSFSFVSRVLLLGILPSYLIFRFFPSSQGIGRELKSKFTLTAVLVVLLVLAVLPFSSQYASFIREHKTVRFLSNPTFFSYSVIKYVSNSFKQPESKLLIHVAEDATLTGHDDRNELLVLVIGETARSDRFSLNGYTRETNPELKKHQVISFKDVSSCGTSTATSVPCMFSSLGRHNFTIKKGLAQEDVLDVLARNGVEILWRDNNSDSKGVADRTTYEDFKKPQMNPVCDTECRDVGMLSGLDKYIAARKGKDILIVLHQMGNHGPAYYKRYPKEFERFTPVCKTNELEKCTKEEIGNAYDNAILYTDYFLSEVIKLLQKYERDHETAMLYVSDHGESLGEYGVYLHGAPYAIAPKAQVHVPAIVWVGENFDYKFEQLNRYVNRPFSHDDLFCAMLTVFEMDSDTCSAWRMALGQSRDAQ